MDAELAKVFVAENLSEDIGDTDATSFKEIVAACECVVLAGLGPLLICIYCLMGLGLWDPSKSMELDRATNPYQFSAQRLFGTLK